MSTLASSAIEIATKTNSTTMESPIMFEILPNPHKTYTKPSSLYIDSKVQCATRNAKDALQVHVFKLFHNEITVYILGHI